MIDLFKVGVGITMSTNSSQILSTMMRELAGVEMAAGRVTSQLNKMRNLAVGVGQVFIGGAMIHGMNQLLEKGIKFNQELAKMKMANFAPADIASLEAQAYQTMKAVPGTNLVDALKGLVDLRNISGSAGHAVALSETIAKVNAVLSNVSGKPAEAAGFMFMKFLEDSGRMMRDGKFSEERVAHEARWMEAVIAATNGRVDGATMFQFRQSGKAAVNSLSDEGLTNLVPAMMSLGPVAVGTAIQGMGQQLLGGVMLKQHTVQWLKDLGELDKRKVSKGRGGNYTLQPGALKDEADILHDPVAWIRHMDKLMSDRGMSADEQVAAWRRSGLRTPLVGLAAEQTQNDATQRKEVDNINRANKVDQYYVMDKESPTFRITKFTEAWTNLQIALGKTIDATQFLVPLTDALNKLNAMAVAHPEAAKDIMELAYALAALTVLSGSLKILGVALGPVATGLGALSNITGLSALGAGLGGIASGLGALVAPVTAIMGILSLGSHADPGVTVPNVLDGINKLRKPTSPTNMVPTDGFGPDGRPVGKHSWNILPDVLYPPRDSPSFNGHRIYGEVTIRNPHDIGRAVSGGLALGMSRPNAGPSYDDYRYSLPAPAFGSLA